MPPTCSTSSRRRRLVGCCDNGSEDVRVFCADVLGASLGDITIADEFSLRTTKRRRRQYIWLDETGAYGQDGTATDPVHNLGFQASADAPPARNSQTFETACYVRPDFRWQDGDTCRLVAYGATATATIFGKFTEEYDRNSGKLPRWRLKVEAWPVFGNTEGGDLPDTVASRAAFAPINVSAFDGVLSANETNIQSALDVIDDHQHSIKDVVGMHANLATVPGASTYYIPPFGALGATANNTIWPELGTFTNLSIRTNGAQPADGSLGIHSANWWL